MVVSSHYPSVDSTGPSHFMLVQYFTLFPPVMRHTSRLWHKHRHNRQGSSETTACTVMTALAKAGVYYMSDTACSTFDPCLPALHLNSGQAEPDEAEAVARIGPS